MFIGGILLYILLVCINSILQLFIGLFRLFCSVFGLLFMFVYVVLVLSVSMLFLLMYFSFYLFYLFSSDFGLCYVWLFYPILQLCVDLFTFDKLYSILFNHILGHFYSMVSLVMLFWSIQFDSFR